MTEPIRKDIIAAHNALNELCNLASPFSAPRDATNKIEKRRQMLLKVLPPKPVPTMADIEWNDNKHFLAEAEHSIYGTVIMIDEARNEHIRFTTSPLSIIVGSDCVPKDQLTPTGYRYVRMKEEDA